MVPCYAAGGKFVHLPLYRHNVFVEASTSIPHVPKVTEYEGSVDVESAGNDVFAVFPGKPLRLFDV